MYKSIDNKYTKGLYKFNGLPFGKKARHKYFTK